jgi:hypothetical protein
MARIECAAMPRTFWPHGTRKRDSGLSCQRGPTPFVRENSVRTHHAFFTVAPRSKTTFLRPGEHLWPLRLQRERFGVTSKRTRAEEIDFLPLKCLDNYASTIRMTAARR